VAPRRRRIPVVGITGSSGKTTTKDMLAAMLAQRGPVLKTPGTLNAPGDVRRTARRLRRHHWAAVYEMASFKPGFIAASCRAVHPMMAIVTNIGLAHAGLLGGMRGVARDKGALVRSLPRSGVAFLNADVPGTRLISLKGFRGRIVRYGLRPQADVWASDVRQDGLRLTFVAHRGSESAELQVRALGEHNVANALAAFAAARELGLSTEAIRLGLANFTPPRGRLQVQTVQGFTLIHDAFNASPQSMEAGLKVLRQIGEGRRVAVIGRMRTLGRWFREAHLKLGGQLASGGIDEVVLVGPACGAVTTGIQQGLRGKPPDTHPRVTKVRTAEAAASYLGRTLTEPAVVFFKGSHDIHLARAFRLLMAELSTRGPNGGGPCGGGEPSSR